MTQLQNPVLLAKIGAPHGVKGEVRVKSFTDDPLAIADYGALIDAKGNSYRVLAARVQKNMVIVRFDGVKYRDQAEALNGVELFVDRSILPEPEDDEFYLADLIGMQLIDGEGIELGKVTDMPNYGAGDLLEYRPRGKKATELLPFTREVFPEIDFEKGKILTVFPHVVSERDVDETEAGGEKE